MEKVIIVKRLAVGFVIGAVLMFSTQAVAENISLIGKKVGSEAKVFIEGKEVSNAIIVNSKSYAPVRDIVEHFGAEAEWVPAKDGDNIIKVERKTTGGKLPQTLETLGWKKDDILLKLSSREDAIKTIEERMVILQEIFESTDSDFRKELVGSQLEECKEQLKEVNAEIASLESQLAEVEAEIKAFESAQSSK